MRALIVAAVLVCGAFPAAAAERGIASTFNDARTACAPFRLNPRILQAAHKTLPCGTLISVTNRINGRRVVAVVADRGPCTTLYCRTRMPARIRARILDMGPALARALGARMASLVPVIVSVVR